jgi:bile acid:Na+ symporter, BASS family
MNLFVKALYLLSHRNFLLSFALVLGLILGENTWILPEISVYVLALVMIFATVDFSFGVFRQTVLSIKTLGFTFFLNYIVFGGLMLLMARFLLPGNELWVGCVLLAAAPPGPSVVPFTAIMKGNVSMGVIGLFGLHLIALAATPLILIALTGQSVVQPLVILIILLKTVVVPLILSRPLRHKTILPVVRKIKGKVINWGFFLIVVPIVGQSVTVMSANPHLIWQSILLFVCTMFLTAVMYNFIALRLKADKKSIIASTFFLTTKSSAFAAVVVFALENEAAGIPAAVHAFFVTLFFLVYSNLKLFSPRHQE